MVEEEEGEEGLEVGEGVDLEEVEDRPQKRRAFEYDELEELDEGNKGSEQVVPWSHKHLRACLICGMVKTLDQFSNQSCDNCLRYVNMRGDKEQVGHNTSQQISGMIAMMDPSKSWVARYQRMQPSWVPAVYALSVKGTPPDETMEKLADYNYHYIPRDFTERDRKNPGQ